MRPRANVIYQLETIHEAHAHARELTTRETQRAIFQAHDATQCISQRRQQSGIIKFSFVARARCVLSFWSGKREALMKVCCFPAHIDAPCIELLCAIRWKVSSWEPASVAQAKRIFVGRTNWGNRCTRWCDYIMCCMLYVTYIPSVNVSYGVTLMVMGHRSKLHASQRQKSHMHLRVFWSETFRKRIQKNNKGDVSADQQNAWSKWGGSRLLFRCVGDDAKHNIMRWGSCAFG